MSIGSTQARDLTIDPRVSGLPDLAHAAFPEEAGRVVVPEAGAGSECHELCESVDRVILRPTGHLLHPTPQELRREGAPRIFRSSGVPDGVGGTG